MSNKKAALACAGAAFLFGLDRGLLALDPGLKILSGKDYGRMPSLLIRASMEGSLPRKRL